MAKFWFIRHGESISNANLPTTHPAASELTPRGELEAEYIALAFSEAPDLIVVSPYARAKQTAVPTTNRFPHVPVEEWPVYEFTYLHPERYNGTTGSERGPHARGYWDRCDPYEQEMAGGESFADLWQRIIALRERLRGHDVGFTAVFSHGLFLRALLYLLLTGQEEVTPDLMWRYKRFIEGIWLPNGAIWEVNVADNGRITFTGFISDHMPVNLDA